MECGWKRRRRRSLGIITGTLSDQTDLQTALNAKAPTASPTFTGTLTAPDGATNTSAGWSVLNLRGATSGTSTITPPAIAGTSTNPFVLSNNITLPVGAVDTPSLNFAGSTNTGIFSPSASGLAIATFGNSRDFWSGATHRMANSENVCWSSGDPTTTSCVVGLARAATGVLQVDTSGANRSGFILAGNSVFVATDFTTAANTNLQTITGLSWTFPATALNWNYHCHLSYSQATGNAAVAFGIQAATNSPTNIFSQGTMQLSTVAGVSTYASGTLATLATTTATAIVSGTPAATATNYVADLGGTLELGASANTVNIMVSTATSGDAVTVLRGSYCSLTP